MREFNKMRQLLGRSRRLQRLLWRLDGLVLGLDGGLLLHLPRMQVQEEHQVVVAGGHL